MKRSLIYSITTIGIYIHQDDKHINNWFNFLMKNKRANKLFFMRCLQFETLVTFETLVICRFRSDWSAFVYWAECGCARCVARPLTWSPWSSWQLTGGGAPSPRSPALSTTLAPSRRPSNSTKGYTGIVVIHSNPKHLYSHHVHLLYA